LTFAEGSACFVHKSPLLLLSQLIFGARAPVRRALANLHAAYIGRIRTTDHTMPRLIVLGALVGVCLAGKMSVTTGNLASPDSYSSISECARFERTALASTHI
jgi:hypothetical protein